MSELKIGITWNCFTSGFTSGFQQSVKNIYSAKEVKNYDLIIFSGGEDISPEIYNEPNISSYINPRRDKFEISILKECFDLNKKIFGVCRGHQLINAYCGGKLNQDIIPRHGGSHFINIINDNNIINYYKDKSVSSLHHQAVSIPGNDFEILAVHDILNTIEATKYGDNILTVQFHPETQSYIEFFNLVKEWC